MPATSIDDRKHPLSPCPQVGCQIDRLEKMRFDQFGFEARSIVVPHPCKHVRDDACNLIGTILTKPCTIRQLQGCPAIVEDSGRSSIGETATRPAGAGAHDNGRTIVLQDSSKLFGRGPSLIVNQHCERTCPNAVVIRKLGNVEHQIGPCFAGELTCMRRSNKASRVAGLGDKGAGLPGRTLLPGPFTALFSFSCPIQKSLSILCVRRCRRRPKLPRQ